MGIFNEEQIGIYFPIANQSVLTPPLSELVIRKLDVVLLPIHGKQYNPLLLEKDVDASVTPTK